VDAAIASAIRTKRPSYIEINMGIWDSANGPALIAAQMDAHGLPAELTGAALARGGPLR
jgi:phage FluMu gp28-like protein